ncbi:MAG: NIPSNAP family protein [Deltaproteobacteria bacterium]|nr:NIPSNAP family protein [Deltaproteobacteria bacterium]MBW1994522.1 NIPSNAP family protein [Deltaproteobacteria bacterium]
MIYEMRTYTLKPGTVAEFEKRFEASLANRLKHSELAAFWHTEIGPLNQVIHIWPYENLGQREEIRARTAKEPDWPPKVQDLLLTMESQIFVPAPFSPKLGGGKKLGNIYEMRIYQYQPGTLPEVLKRWEQALNGGRLELSPIAACMSSEIGILNRWVHIWPYKSLEERSRIRAESKKLDTWPPKTREFMVSQQTKIMIPASFSPTA